MSVMHGNNELAVDVSETVECLRNELNILFDMVQQTGADCKRHAVDLAEHELQIAYLLNVRKRKLRPSILQLLHDAEKVVDKSIFSVEAQVYLSRYVPGPKDEVNCGDYGICSQECIRTAILDQLKPGIRTILTDLFVNTYHVTFEVEDDFAW
jgi:hypothetical protein